MELQYKKAIEEYDLTINQLPEDAITGIEQIHPFAGNASLIINALDNLSGTTSLIDLRSKAEWHRPFTVIEKMALEAGQKYRKQEARLFLELQETQANLKKLTQKSSDADKDTLSHEDKAEIQALQKRIISLRSSLRAVQNVLSYDILALKSKLILLNVVFVPALLVIIALFIAWRKSVRRTQSR